ncbi:glycoside hydrolase family 3 protein [Marinicellulosiphila megalodicopiae]|uniref:glycoside hydrolase family 3 protein n=1 Tax=Marinicellulosiphila megalodicopiae TaxID=2724896 RepID=UPI003BB0BE00
MNLKLISTAAILATSVLACKTNFQSQQTTSVTSNRAQTMEQKVAALVASMSLAEKVGQMTQADIPNITAAQVKEFHLGSVLNGGGSKPYNNPRASIEDWLTYADGYYEASISKENGRIGIPIIWGTDAVHGHNNVIGATIFPHNIGLGAANNPELMQKIGEITALEVRITGQDWTFAPTLAVARNDRWGRTYEAYSEDPSIVVNLADDIIRGIQGDNDFKTNTLAGNHILADNHIIATAKHFVGDGGTLNGDDQGDNQSTLQELKDIHMPGYLPAINENVQTVMASYSKALGEKMHGNKLLLTDVLRGELGFDGFVIGDWDGHAQVEGCNTKSCPQAINAGIDMMMVPNDWQGFIEGTIKDVKSGKITMARIDEAVSRILTVKMRMGMFEQTKPSLRPYANKTELLGSADHRAVARQAVRESLVLLKNTNAILPLERNLNVLVAGLSADSMRNQTGGWTIDWQGNVGSNSDFPNGSTIFDGIEKLVTDAGGQAKYNRIGAFKPDEKPDVVIYVFGESPYAEMMGDRDESGIIQGSQDGITMMYQERVKRDLKALTRFKEAGIPVVGIFVSGRPMVLNQEIEQMDAFIAAWLPGSEGNGIAEVIFKNNAGEVNFDFKGKLSFSWPKNPTDAELNVGNDVYDPLYPFGYGLNYLMNGY